MHRSVFALALVLTACHSSGQPAGDPANADAALASLDGGTTAPGLAPDPDLAGTPDYCNATDPRTVAADVFATPEAGEQPYVDVLTAAQSSIHVEIYLMGQGAILDTLVAKAKAGLDVRLILDEGEKPTNQKYADQLTAAGAQILWSDPKFPYMHAKFFVVDGKEAVVSTGNFSRDYSILLERNFLARLRDPADVADLATLFDADWARANPDLSCTRMVISPVNARQRVLDLIASATTTLTVESMQFADDDVRAAIAARVQAGVAVRAMIAQPSWISANTQAALYLHGLGVEVRTIPHLHVKAIVADGARGYLGSENLSYTSLSKNREAGLVTIDAASVAPLVSTFEKDWAAGTAL
jgi:phosphatidylserine/phosphatidylglycerophosphate/cardiolipin synthase-like enzyme